MTTKRTDVHRPSAIRPQDYQLVDGLGQFEDYEYPAGRCAHCGHAIRYAVRFDHIPTGERLDLGQECAELVDTENRVAYIVDRMKKAAREKAKAERAQKDWFERREQMENEYPDVVEWMEDHNWENESFGFLNDMHWAFDRYGSLTEAQTKAVQRIMAKRIEQAAAKLDEVEPTDPAPFGRQAIEGEIVTVKAPDPDAMFPAWKMMVKLDDGNKVWGTIPATLKDAVEHYRDLRGKRVAFTATFEVSKDDEHFAYYKRPTKGEVL